jgi:hypothetical protein
MENWRFCKQSNVKKIYGLTKLLGEEHIYNSLPDVLEAFRKGTNQVGAEPGS